MQGENNLSVVQAQPEADVKTYDLVTSGDLLLNADNFSMLQEFAAVMATGVATVPKHLAGNKGDCMAVAMQAVQWGMNPYAVAQKTHIVNGQLGYEAQLVNAVVMSSGAIRGSFKYEYQGDGAELYCRVGAVLAGESDVTWGEWLGVGQVAVKNSPLWKSNPRQQLGYLQVKNWARSYCPGAILGVYTADELSPAQEAAASHSRVVDSTASLPEYEDARFNANFGKYSKAIADGEKTAEEIINLISSRYSMTEEQRDAYVSFELDLKAEKEGAES